MKYRYHKDGELPAINSGWVFVFGSNLAGVHGAGAAKAALKYGAKLGMGEGLHGQSYALPTKDKNIKTLPIDSVRSNIEKFIAFAGENPNMNFFLTRVGCGLAGFKDSEIAPLFIGAPLNISFPDPWARYIEGIDKGVDLSEVKISMRSCMERYLAEIVDSIEFENGKLTEAQLEEVKNTVTVAINNAIDSI